MGSLPRFIPEGALIEVTTRTIGARFLLRPSRDLNEIVVGALAKAAQLYRVKVCAFVFLSNHAHLLLQPDDARQLADFMNYVNGNIAREVCRLHGWQHRVWSDRYRSIVVSNKEIDQVARLRYLLDNGCKENLVRRPQDWPGASSVEALLTGRPLTGVWFSRTDEYEARRRGKKPRKYDHAEVLELELSPLPAWLHLEPDQIRARVAALVQEIEVQTRERLRRAGQTALGAKRICQIDPHSAPEEPSRSPAPRFHAIDKEVRRQLESAFREFVDAYRAAAEALRAGVLDAPFPPGCFKPRPPFSGPGLALPA